MVWLILVLVLSLGLGGDNVSNLLAADMPDNGTTMCGEHGRKRFIAAALIAEMSQVGPWRSFGPDTKTRVVEAAKDMASLLEINGVAFWKDCNFGGK